MKLHQLRDVIAVAEAGSLRAASRELKLSQSAMTKSIQALEKEIGTPIFERHKQGTVLTPLGALFVQRARAATGELSRASDEIQQHLGMGTGRVVACLSAVPHMTLLPEVLPAFLKRYPAVQLSILEALEFATAEAALRNGEIDFYIGVGPVTPLATDLVMEKIFDNERCVICRKESPYRAARSLRELIDARWSISSAKFADSDFAALFERYRLPVPVQRTLGASVLAQIVCLLYSDMLAIAPRQWPDFEPFKGLIRRVPVKETIGAPSVVLVRRAALPLTPAAEYFCDLARRAGGRVPPPAGS